MEIKKSLRQAVKGWRSLSFPREQERRFEKMIEQRTAKFFWFIAAFLTLFQLYNITYALIYTDFRLDSVASRVYMALYVLMLAVSVAVMLIRYRGLGREPDRQERFLFLYSFYAAVLIFWSVCLTLYDQRVSDNLTVYLTVTLSMAGLIYMRPSFSIPVYLLSETLLLAELHNFQQGTISNNYGKYVNSVSLAIVALFISLYRNYNLRHDFLNQEIIARQTQEIQEKNDELNYIANHDALTGLWNRNYLDRFTEQLFLQDSSLNAALFMIDIDYFKQYNDTFGHLKGDECLHVVAEAMSRSLQQGELFRYGGEEFLLVLTDPHEGLARETGDLLWKSVASLNLPSPVKQRHLTVSIGYSEGKVTTLEEFMELLNQADNALYDAKHLGRNQVVKYAAKASDCG